MTQGCTGWCFSGNSRAKKELDVEEFLSLFALFIGHPAAGLRRIRERPSMLTGYVALILTGIADALSFRLIDMAGLLQSLGLTTQMVQSVRSVQQAPGTFWGFVAEPFFVTLLCVVIIDAVAQLAWKKTAAPFLFIALSFSGLIGGILRLAGLLLGGVANGILLDVLSYAAVLYTVIMGVLSVRFFYEKSTFKAILAYFVPVLLGALVIILLALTLGGAA